jgi:hypothetical protein
LSHARTVPGFILLCRARSLRGRARRSPRAKAKTILGLTTARLELTEVKLPDGERRILRRLIDARQLVHVRFSPQVLALAVLLIAHESTVSLQMQKGRILSSLCSRQRLTTSLHQASVLTITTLPMRIVGNRSKDWERARTKMVRTKRVKERTDRVNGVPEVSRALIGCNCYKVWSRTADVFPTSTVTLEEVPDGDESSSSPTETKRPSVSGGKTPAEGEGLPFPGQIEGGGDHIPRKNDHTHGEDTAYMGCRISVEDSDSDDDGPWLVVDSSSYGDQFVDDADSDGSLDSHVGETFSIRT